jgi:hypothetical protein
MGWVNIALLLALPSLVRTNSTRLRKKQDNQIAAQLRQQAASEEKVNQRTKQFALQQQQQTDEPQKTAASKAYDQGNDCQQGDGQSAAGNVGNVSDAYKKPVPMPRLASRATARI